MSDELNNRQIRTDISMQVVARDKEIHLLFSEKNQAGELVPAYTANFLLSPNDALVMSSLMADLAFEAESGLKMPGAQKQELVERHRSVLMNRITTLLNEKREQKTISTRSLARLLVDVMSSEIFH